jgi:hypothetical protein
LISENKCICVCSHYVYYYKTPLEYLKTNYPRVKTIYLNYIQLNGF